MGRGYLTRQQFEGLPELPPAVLFTGDLFQLNRYREKLKEQLAQRGEVVTLYPDQIKLEEVRELLRPSLFGGVAGVILVLDRWISGLEQLGKEVEGTHLLLFYIGKERVEKRGFPVVVRFFPPDEGELRQFIAEKGRELGLQLEEEVVELLLRRVDPPNLAPELQKLALYPGQLDLKVAEELIFPHREESFEELFYRFLEGVPGATEGLLEVESQLGASRLFGLITYYLRELFRVYLFIEETGNSRLKELYGYQLPVKVERRRVQLALRLRPNLYRELFRLVLRLQLTHREGKGDPALLVKGGLAGIAHLLHRGDPPL